jgi:hypothetical protein
MLSSIGFHISSFSASRLPGRSLPPGMRMGNPEARRALIAEMLRRFDACMNSPDDVVSLKRWANYMRERRERQSLDESSEGMAARR